MDDHKAKKEIRSPGNVLSRRDFLKTSGIVVIGVGLGGCVIPGGVALSEGYLLVDTRKCQGCLTCMLACSLVHEGFESLSLARIQVVQNPFESFPGDIHIAQCRQCVKPACLDACQFDALYVDPANGNVRIIDEDRCVGCGECVRACPFPPGRSIWNFEARPPHSQKCDLCVTTHFWQEEGGPDGKQACVTVCPMKAISFTQAVPLQEGEEGYNVNLRDEDDIWERLGYTRE